MSIPKLKIFAIGKKSKSYVYLFSQIIVFANAKHAKIIKKHMDNLLFIFICNESTIQITQPSYIHTVIQILKGTNINISKEF